MPLLADGGTLPPRAVSLGIFKEEFEMGTRGGLIVFRDQHIVSLSWLLGSSVQKTRGFVKILHYLEDEVSERTMTKTLILERIIQVARTACLLSRSTDTSSRTCSVREAFIRLNWLLSLLLP